VAFRLDENNAALMTGRNVFDEERFADIAGNFYTREFISGFSYEDRSRNGPRVYARVEPCAETFAGRIEAHGLKPNFAYQVKLCGDFNDRRSFERIGRLGRWRLPGRRTNYSDYDYQACTNKSQVEAYILFDYFVTDANGDAVKDFRLDRSLHVLRNTSREKMPILAGTTRSFRVVADQPDVYARPKTDHGVERITEELERVRYWRYRKIALPAGRYRAFLKLTEESFHARGRDGGHWATVLNLPVEFEVVREDGG